MAVRNANNGEMRNPAQDEQKGFDPDGGEGGGSWQALSLFQGPAHDAGLFYNQIHDEINALRGRVDKKLQDMIVGGREDIESLNQQVKSLKSTTSSDGSGTDKLPAVEVVAGKVLKRGQQQRRLQRQHQQKKGNKGKPNSKPQDDSSFGDLRVSASAATEPATNLTRTVDSRQYNYTSPAPSQSHPSVASSHPSVSEQESGMSDEDSGVVSKQQQEQQQQQSQQQSQRRLRPQRQKLNSKPPPYSPNDAVAAARHAIQDDAVTNARYGRASPPRRRFFPEDPVVRRRVPAAEGGMSAMSTSPTANGREVRYGSVPEESAMYGKTAQSQQYGSSNSQSQSSADEGGEYVAPSATEELHHGIALGRTGSEVQRSFIHKLPEDRTPDLPASPPSARDAPETERDYVPDPDPTAIARSRSYKYPHSAAASTTASTSASDQFEIMVPSNRSEANLSTKSRVSALSTPIEVTPMPKGRTSSNPSSHRSTRAGGRSYPAEVKLPPKHTSSGGADNRSEANMSTRSRISGLSEPFEGALSPKSRESECLSNPRSDDLLMASLEFLEESRRLTSDHRLRKSTTEQFARQVRSSAISAATRSRMSDMSAARSRTSEVSFAKSGTSELSYGSGLKPDEVDLLKASLAYLQCNNQLPMSPPSQAIRPPRQPLSRGSSEASQRLQSPTRPQHRGGEDQRRQSPVRSQHQHQHHMSLPDHLRPIANGNGGTLQRQHTETTALTSSSYTKSRRSSQDLHGIREERNNDYEVFDWADQSVSHQSYASKSIAAKSANLVSLASSSVTENMEVKGEHRGNEKDLLALIEKEVGGAAGGVVRVERVQNHPITDPYGDTGRYTGLLVKEKPYGHGSMHYDDGRSYTGEWKNGRWHGKGRTLFVNGDFYVGEYAKDQRHGLGRYEWSDGRFYDGQFKRDRREGKGTYSWPDGAIYTGDFKNGHRHGQGCYKFKDGSVFTGEFRNGKYHGVGECVWADRRCYRGEWSEGHAHGYGVEMRPDGSVRHDGEWRKDRPIRKAKTREELQEDQKKKEKGCKMPESNRKHRVRPTPGGSPGHSFGSFSPRKNVARIDP